MRLCFKVVPLDAGIICRRMMPRKNVGTVQTRRRIGKLMVRHRVVDGVSPILIVAEPEVIQQSQSSHPRERSRPPLARGILSAHAEDD